ncbi:MAG: hypothetical protein ACPLX7_10205 [Candidatus Kapaibacteriota bacterium]
MKKIYFIVVIVLYLALGKIFLKAQDACQNCTGYYPFCYVLEIPTDVCPSNQPSYVVFCYDIKDCPNQIHIGIVYMEIDPSCFYQIWEFFPNWLRSNIVNLCGYKPCDEPPPMEIYYTVPICGSVEWIGAQRRLIYRNSNNFDCDKRCITKYLFCIDGFETHWVPVSKTIIGIGDCPEIPYGDGTIYPFTTDPTNPNFYWQIECTKIIGVNCEL